MSGAATATLVDELVARLAANDFEGLVELYRADAVLDANVPHWRYQLQGRAAIAAQLKQEAPPGARVTSVRPTVTERGVAVEIEGRFGEGSDERLWREVHLFATDGAAVTEHVIYCTGLWDAATIARQAAEAPMVRR